MAVLGVAALAASFRFLDINNFPPGLFPDEAANGEDALLILKGDWRPFYPRGNGREGLFFYLLAFSVKIFGVGFWQIHAVSAMVGVLTVLGVYFATRVWFGRQAGFLAAFLLATNHWHVTLSRTGFRAILIPLFVAAFTAFAGYAIRFVSEKGIGNQESGVNWQRKVVSYLFAVLAGAAFASGFYTYIAYRVMIGVVGGVFLLLLISDLMETFKSKGEVKMPHFRRYGWHVLWAVVAGLIVLAPLGWYFVKNPADFVGRAGQVSVFNEDLQEEYGDGSLWLTIWYSMRETTMSFFYGEGDLNWRHNVSGYPLLNPLVGVLGLLGLAWAFMESGFLFKKICQGKEIHLSMVFPYLLLLLFGMVLPVVTTIEGVPHALRSVGMVVPIFMLAGTAGAVAIHWFQKRYRSGIIRDVFYGLAAGILLLTAVYDGALYFFVSRNDSQAHYAYRADLTEVSKYINEKYEILNVEKPETNSESETLEKLESGAGSRPYLVLDKFSLQTVHFLTHSVKHRGWKLISSAHDHTVGDEDHSDEADHKWTQLDPEDSHLTALKPGEIIIFTQSTIFDTKRYEEMYPEIELIDSRTNRFGQEIMRVYGLKEEGEVEGMKSDERGYDLDA